MAVGETVVLLMTDVEASTRLGQEAPDEMDASMRRHHDLLHAAIEEHGGWRPVDQGEGDAVFAAFRSAPAAVRAALRAQHQLQNEPWSPQAPLRVRMGLHAGDVRTRGGNLFGDTVSRCARIRGVAAGEQIVLSSVVFELIRDQLDDGVGVVELGDHRLKDLTRPERLFQLSGPGLRSEFPPLASLERAQHNLPMQGSTFVGRETELAEILALLRSERLVTITGFGGMGKTRLALQAAAELADGDGDGVWFVDLSGLADHTQVPAQLAAALGVIETGSGAADAVLHHVADRQLLLVLDNLEQVLGCAPWLADLMASCPGVSILATSREALHLRAEREYVLPPLNVPSRTTAWGEDVERLSMFEAVRLLVDRAVSASPGFAITNQSAPAVAEIVARLDGHPLAIELAAARLKVLSPQALLARLDRALTVLTGGGRDHPERHQTLHATIAWSYDLLPEVEKELLNRLSVFAAAPLFEAIEAVCGPGGLDDVELLDGVAALVDKSLLRAHDATGSGGRRFSLLGSIRDFTAARLNETDRDEGVRTLHASYYCALGQPAQEWDPAAEEAALCAIGEDIPELLEALRHLSEHGDLRQLPWTLIEHLTRSGQLTQAIAISQLLLDRIPEPDGLRLHASHQLAWSLERSGRYRQADGVRRNMLAEARLLGEPAEIAFALCGLLAVAGRREDALRLIAELEQAFDALRVRSGTHELLELNSHAANALSIALRYVDPARSLDYAQQHLSEIVGMEGQQTLLVARGRVVRCHLVVGDLPAAAREAELIDVGDDSGLGPTRRPASLALVAQVAARTGNTTRARELAERAVVVAAETHEMCGDAELLLAELDLMAADYRAVLERQEAFGSKVSPEDNVRHGGMLCRAAEAARRLGDTALARILVDDALAALRDYEVLALPDLRAAELIDARLSENPREVTERLATLERELAPTTLLMGLSLELPAEV